MIMKVRKDYLNVTCNVATDEIMRTSRLVRDLCGMPVQPNKAVVGSNGVCALVGNPSGRGA